MGNYKNRPFFNEFGRIITSNIKHWNQSALACYKCGCNCDNCEYTEFFKSSKEKCNMKAYVYELTKILGKPDITDSIFSFEEKRVIKAILEGATKKQEIAKKINSSYSKTQLLLDNVVFVAKTHGFKPKNQRDRIPELVEWLRKMKGKQNECL